MPLILQTPCFRTTIWESFGCCALSSCLTSSELALCSTDNWIAAIPPVFPTFFPSTIRESPAFATWRVPWLMTPTRQHVPVVAKSGRVSQRLETRDIKPSLVAKKDLQKPSGVTPCGPEEISAQRQRQCF